MNLTTLSHFGHKYHLTFSGNVVVDNKIEIKLPFHANYMRRGGMYNDAVFFSDNGEYGDWTLLWYPDSPPELWMIGKNDGSIKEKPLFLAGVNPELKIEVVVTGQSSLRRRPRTRR
jgi:hypothetical protein